MFVVEHSLPKKKEYLLYAPLTRAQKNLYDAILNRDIREYLINRKTKAFEDKQPQPQQPQQPLDDEENKRNQRSAKGDIDYKEKSDTQYFKELEKAADENTTPLNTESVEKKQQISAASKYKETKKPFHCQLNDDAIFIFS